MAFCLSAIPPVSTAWAWKGCRDAVSLCTLLILTACGFNVQLLLSLIPLPRPFNYILRKVWPTNATHTADKSFNTGCSEHLVANGCHTVTFFFSKKCVSPWISSQAHTRQEMTSASVLISLLMASEAKCNKDLPSPYLPLHDQKFQCMVVVIVCIILMYKCQQRMSTHIEYKLTSDTGKYPSRE